MSRKFNVINFVVSMAVTLAGLFLVVTLCNNRYSETMFNAFVKIGVGAILAGFVNTIAHELGHLVAGKKNGFVFSAMTVWFFKWQKVKNKVKFSYVMLGEEAGYTEMIPTQTQELDKKLKKLASGGYKVSFVMMLLGIPALFVSALPVWIFCLWSMFLPIGAYFFFGSVLPASNYGIRNDGAVVYGIKNDDDVSKVTINLLTIQAEMYNGKTPAQIDENLYFDLPQLPEDDVNFILLLNARYVYYLDKEDYENAKKVTARLVGLVDEMPKDYRPAIMVDALYNACTFDFNEEVADNITEDYEKFLNSVNNVVTVRAKLAYLLYVKRETESFDIFYKKGVKEANKSQIAGLKAFELKLYEKLKADFEKIA